MEAYNLSTQKIIERLSQENITLPAGNLKTGYLDYTLRLIGEFQSPAQLRDVILAQFGEKKVYLKDVAEIEDSYKEETMVLRTNGKPGVMMMVQKRSGANTVDIARKIKTELKKIEKRLPQDIKFSILMDSSEHIIQSIRDLTQTLYWGGIFVVLVVYIFLRQIRPSLIIALTIPFSLIISFIFMYFFGYTLNILSLSSLAIAIGMVVDNAIVIVDNAYRHRERGESPHDAAINGTSEVGLAVSASTFTTVVVFLPMIFLSGITGIMFKQLAIVITVTLLASLFTALTFSAMLCSKLLTVLPPERFNNKNKPLYRRFYEISGKLFTSLESAYGRLLNWALKHKKTTVFIAIGVFVLSLALVPKIGTEFIPEEDTGDLNIQIELPVGTRVEETDKIAKQIEAIFKKDIPETRTIFSRVGYSSTSRFGSAFGQKLGSNIITVGAKLCLVTERKRTVKEIAEAIRPKVRSLLGVKKINIQAGSPFSRILFGGGKPISIEILGHDLEVTDNIAYKLRDEISQIKGVTDATISRELGKPELEVEVDRLKAASLGLNMDLITDTLRTYFYGKAATKYREAGDEYDIFVRLKDSDRRSVKDIKDIPIISAGGKIVRLNNVAQVIHRTGPIEIERQNQDRIVRVEANTFKRSLGQITKDIKEVIAKTNLPYDVRINLGGDIEEQAKSFRDLFVLFILGGILVYMVMASQFESMLDPFVVIFSVPFAFCGTAFGLFLTGIPLSINAFIGLVMLVGIVVNNAIVLVDYINILCRRGVSLTEAIVAGGTNRLRPILMTTITTIFGMLPLALSRGEGSELWRPLGISMLSGLSLSTLVTLVLVPVIYTLFKHKSQLQKIK